MWKTIRQLVSETKSRTTGVAEFHVSDSWKFHTCPKKMFFFLHIIFSMCCFVRAIMQLSGMLWCTSSTVFLTYYLSLYPPFSLFQQSPPSFSPSHAHSPSCCFVRPIFMTVMLVVAQLVISSVRTLSADSDLRSNGPGLLSEKADGSDPGSQIWEQHDGRDFALCVSMMWTGRQAGCALTVSFD